MQKHFREQNILSDEIQQLRYLGRLNDAIQKCKEATERYPEDNFFHKILGDIYLQIGDTAKAAEEHLLNLKLLKTNTELFRNFIRFYRLYEKKAPSSEVIEYKKQIKDCIINKEFSPEMVECLISFLGNEMIVDEELLEVLKLSDRDIHYDLVKHYLDEWDRKKNLSNIKALINHRVSAPANKASRRIMGLLANYAERVGLYTESLQLVEKSMNFESELQSSWNILRICRRLDDYSFAEKKLSIDEKFIDRSDFNNQYELVYYFQSRNDSVNLDKTLKRMRTSATRSIPIARTLYNFYLSFEMFDEAQEVYSHIQKITEEKRRTKQLERRTEQLETEQAVWQKLKELVSEQEHNRQLTALRDLLKGFSHELGQPITNIRYAVQLHLMKMERGIVSSEATYHLMESILEQTARVGSLLARFRPIVSSKSTNEVFGIKECISEVFGDLSPRLKTKGIEYQIIGDSTLNLFGDKIQFSQVFYNLVLNSLQAMNVSGEIRVKVTRASGAALISFSDTGPGIPPENHQKVFEPFFSTKDPTSGNGGEGLGLFIVWNILKMFNATIRVDPKYHKGARFLINMPIKEDSNEQSIDS